MELLIFILLLLILLIISNVIAHYISFIPIALIQIGIGLVAAILLSQHTFEIESEWFLLLFIAPLLYHDGAHFPREQLWRMRFPILGNAIVLVLLTTIIGGLFVHWLIPSIPLAAAFALMAILSPTDPVAVDGIASRVQIPERIMNLVRGESLINDASGLIGFKYGVAAIVTGYFSLKTASLDFLYTFIVGVAIGLLGALALFIVRMHFRRIGIVDPTFYVLLQILTPFILYFVSEEVFHASGVMAVVTGGIIAAILREKGENMIAQEQIVTDHMWTILTFVLNGVIFLLLGLLLPSATSDILANNDMKNTVLVGYVLAIGVVVLAIRFCWMVGVGWFEKRFLQRSEEMGMKEHVITTLVGVRGTITMVGIISLPFLTVTGETFPHRQLLIFLAAGVILFTLILATIMLPLLNEKQVTQQLDLTAEKQKMIRAAMQAVQREARDDNATAAIALMRQYQTMQLSLERKQSEKTLQSRKQDMVKVRMIGLQLEEHYAKVYTEHNPCSEAVVKEIHYVLKQRKDHLKHSAFALLKRRARQFIHEWQLNKQEDEVITHIETVRKHMTNYVINAIIDHVQHAPDLEPELAQRIELYYRQLQYAATDVDADEREEQKEYLSLVAIEAQRQMVNMMYKKGEITTESAKELRRFVNNLETVILLDGQD